MDNKTIKQKLEQLEKQTSVILKAHEQRKKAGLSAELLYSELLFSVENLLKIK